MSIVIHFNFYAFFPGHDPCLASPCQNGGTCRSSAQTGFICECPFPYINSICSLGKVRCLAANGGLSCVGFSALRDFIMLICHVKTAQGTQTNVTSFNYIYIYTPGRPTSVKKWSQKCRTWRPFWTSVSGPYAVTLDVSLRWSAES